MISRTKRGFISFEWLFAAAFALMFTAATVPNMFDDGVRTYEVITENNKKLVYEELDEDSGIYITGGGESIHPDVPDEGEILPPGDGSGEIGDGDARIDTITISPDQLTMEIGETHTLSYGWTSTIPGKDPANLQVSWSTDNPGVAKVNQKGVVTAVSPGNATIMVSALGSDAKDTMYIEVNPVAAKDIILNTDKIDLMAGNTFQLKATVLPNNTTNKTVIYTTEDPSVATVSPDGLVTAKNPSVENYRTNIVATCGKIQKKVPVTVEGTITPTTGIKFDKDSYTVEVGANVKIVATTIPGNATVQEFTFNTSDDYYATVNDVGIVTGQREGRVNIEACNTGGSFFGDKVCESVPVNIIPASHPLKSLKISYEDNEIQSGGTLNPIVEYNPSNTTERGLVWSSSNNEVISVDEEGRITGKKNGTATITATSVTNPSISASVDVTTVGYIVPVESIILKEQNINMNIGEAKQLTATVVPSNATNKKVYYVSSDTSVVTVGETGKVIALSEGTAIITAISEENNKIQATTTINVHRIPVESVSWDEPSKKVTIPEGGTINVGYTLKPDNATNKNVTIESANPEIANYMDGTVFGYTKGTTNITIEAEGGLKDILTVEVVSEEIEGIELKENEITLKPEETYNIVAKLLPENLPQKFVYTILENETTVKYVGYEDVCETDPETGKESCYIDRIETNEPAEVISLEGNKIKAMNPGQAVISVGAQADPDINATLTINVEPIKVTDVIIATEEKDMVFTKIGEQKTIVTSILPAEATDTELVYIVDDPEIVSVDLMGKVTSKKFGETDITIAAYDGITYDDEGNMNLDNTAKTKIHVTVKDAAIHAEEIVTDDPLDFAIMVGEQKQLHAKVLPENATDKTIKWESSDNAIASVDQTGKVTGVGKGNTTIIASHSDGLILIFNVQVRQKDIEKFIVSPNTLILPLGESATYSIESIPTTITANDYNVSVSNNEGEISDIVTVDKAGKKITAKKEGTAYINFDVPDIRPGDDLISRYKNQITVIVKDGSEIWDGTTTTKPSVEDGKCIIDSASDFAWIAKNSASICSTLEFRTNVDLNEKELPSIRHNYDSVIGNGYKVSNGVFTNTYDKSDSIGMFNTFSGTISDFNIEDIEVQSNSNIKYIGGLAGKLSNNVVLNNVSISNINLNVKSSVQALGYIGGYEANGLTMLDIRVQNSGYSLGEGCSIGKQGGLVGDISESSTNAININGGIIKDNIIMNSTSAGELFANANKATINFKNFYVNGVTETPHALFGSAAGSTIDFANYYLTAKTEKMPSSAYAISQSGNLGKFNSKYGYYSDNLSAKHKLAPNVANHSGLIATDVAKMEKTYEFDNTEFVANLNKASADGYRKWVQADIIGFPTFGEGNNGLTGIKLNKKELVIFSPATKNILVDTSYKGIPDGAKGETVTCASLNPSIVSVDKNSCRATAGSSSGTTKIRVTVDGKYYDDINVTSYPLTKRWSAEAALTSVIEEALVRDSLAGTIEYKKPTPATWTAKLPGPSEYTYNVIYESTSGRYLGNATITKDVDTVNTVTAPEKNGYKTPAPQTVKWDVENKTIRFMYQPITYTIGYDLDGGNWGLGPLVLRETGYEHASSDGNGQTFSMWDSINLSKVDTLVIGGYNRDKVKITHVIINGGTIRVDNNNSFIVIPERYRTETASLQVVSQDIEPYDRLGLSVTGYGAPVENKTVKFSGYAGASKPMYSARYNNIDAKNLTTLSISGVPYADIFINGDLVANSVSFYNVPADKYSGTIDVRIEWMDRYSQDLKPDLKLTYKKEIPASYTVESNEIKIPNPESNNKFIGWTGSNGTTPQKDLIIPTGSTGNKTYKANWEIKPVYLTGFRDYLGKAKTLKFTKTAIPKDKIASAHLVSASDSPTKAYLYTVNDVAYISPEIDNAKIYAPSNSMMLFYSYYLTSIDFANFDTSKVTNMSQMFFGTSLTSLDLSGFDTSNVTDMSYMFQGLQSLVSLNISNFDTSKVTDMTEMFSSCTNLSGEITIMNSNLSYYTNMFSFASTNPNAKFYVKAKPGCEKLVEKIVSTKSANSNVFVSH